jgi:hypothetical protein
MPEYFESDEALSESKLYEGPTRTMGVESEYLKSVDGTPLVTGAKKIYYRDSNQRESEFCHVFSLRHSGHGCDSTEQGNRR